MSRAIGALLLLLLLAPSYAGAQSPLPDSYLGAGTAPPAVAWADGGVWGGPVDGPWRLDAAQSRRHTRRGLRTGAVIGVIGGLGLGGMTALICAMAGGRCPAAIPVITILGAGAGAIGGAIIGAAIPDEAASPPRTDPTERRRDGPAAGRIGSGSVALGGASALLHDEGERVHYDGGGATLRANLYAELKPWLAIGPEVGVATFGAGGRVNHGALAVRGTASLGPVSPYVSAHAGAYQTTGPGLVFLGGGMGLGARYSPAPDRPFFIDIEARTQRHLQVIAPMRMHVLSVGAGLYW
jgi:hypothetical protein